MNWFVFAALFVAGCNASPSHNEAARADGVVSVAQVNMSNIDVSSEAGADRLLRRIRDGAQLRCRVGRNLGGELTAARRQICMRAVMAGEVARAESPVVTARFGRIGEAMIEAAIPGDTASANPQVRTDASYNASVRDELVTPAEPNLSANLTTEELNRREGAQVRATIGTSKQDPMTVLRPEG